MKNLSSVISSGLIISALMLGFISCKKETAEDAARNGFENSNTRIHKSANPGLPDLTIDAGRLSSSVSVKTRMFKSGDCAMIEGCVGGTGKRKLMRFDVATPNLGPGDMVLGDPSQNPALYTFSACHGHYHFNGYATYELLNSSGAVVLTGRKQAFCLLDYTKYLSTAGPAQFTCANQGITAGWQDVYASYLDCQWLDITGLSQGNYQLRVSINPDGLLTESNYNNNVATVPVVVPR